eukprot:6161713-Pyramimonas_sp.AAC.1
MPLRPPMPASPISLPLKVALADPALACAGPRTFVLEGGILGSRAPMLPAMQRCRIACLNFIPRRWVVMASTCAALRFS